MPSSYSPLLRTELIALGEQVDTWGTTNNRNIGTLLEAAISGVATVVMTDANYTLTALNGVSDEARSMGLSITGTLTAARNVVCPTSTKMYLVKNATTGGFAITLKTLAGTGISVPSGAWAVLLCDGTNVVSMTLATIFTSAQLAAAVSDETGSGALVFGTSPTFSGPVVFG